MRGMLIGALLISCSLGCESIFHRKACLPGEPCSIHDASPPTTITAPAPRIEVQTPETIIVRPPAPKVVYEQQAQPANNFGAAPQNNNNFGAGQMPMGYYPAMQQNGGFGGGNNFVGGEIKDRTAIGFMFDTIKIPIPWIRLKAIPQPSEVTFRTQLANNNNFGSPVMMNAGGFGGMQMMPQQGFGAMPMMPQQGFGSAAGNFGGGQMVYTGTQYVPMQGTMPVQVPTNTNAASGVAGTANGGFGGAAPTNDSAADAIEKLKQKIKECEELQTKLKTLQPPGK